VTIQHLEVETTPVDEDSVGLAGESACLVRQGLEVFHHVPLQQREV